MKLIYYICLTFQISKLSLVQLRKKILSHKSYISINNFIILYKIKYNLINLNNDNYVFWIHVDFNSIFIVFKNYILIHLSFFLKCLNKIILYEYINDFKNILRMESFCKFFSNVKLTLLFWKFCDFKIYEGCLAVEHSDCFGMDHCYMVLKLLEKNGFYYYYYYLNIYLYFFWIIENVNHFMFFEKQIWNLLKILVDFVISKSSNFLESFI